MKCLITGGAGFIGSHLVDRLVGESHEVIAIDNLSSGRMEFVEGDRRRSNFKLVKADLLDLRAATKAGRGCEAVFHLAANPDVRQSLKNTRLDLEQETLATYNLLEAMRVNGIKKIIFASSSTVYGETPPIPLPEDYGPLLPISLYGAGKLASEALISSFCNVFSMQAWIFRFANVVGDRATHGVIFDFINKLRANPHELEILGDGTQSKPYIHVQDCIDGMLYGMNNSGERVNVFNLGCDSVSNVTAIAGMLITALGLKDVKLKYTGGDRGWTGDVPQVRLDVSRINHLGWKARYSSDEAVAQAIKDILA